MLTNTKATPPLLRLFVTIFLLDSANIKKKHRIWRRFYESALFGGFESNGLEDSTFGESQK